jgi:tRNA threonylcarbamoyl adenosine modification protein YjeE
MRLQNERVLSDSSKDAFAKAGNFQGENSSQMLSADGAQDAAPKKFFKKIKITPAAVAKIAVLSAISFVLYAFCKFNLPMIFPSFLDIQFSELPALLAGFSMGPFAGCAVIIIKCLLKFPMSSTMFVGEITDIALGISFVLPASLIYRYNKTKKGAAWGLFAGVAASTAAAVLLNRFVSIPFYIQLFFKGNWNILLNMVKPLYPSVSRENFYAYYLLLAIVPFNLLRGGISGLLTFLTYKRLSAALHWEFGRKNIIIKDIGGKNLNVDEKEEKIDLISGSGEFVSNSISQTYDFAEQIARALIGSETIILDGDLGAGKTTFTKGLARALGITAEVTSPTFTILNIYEGGKFPLYHIDMYRILSADELAETGVSEYLARDGVTVIEWNKFTDIKGKVINIKITATGENTRHFLYSGI